MAKIIEDPKDKMKPSVFADLYKEFRRDYDTSSKVEWLPSGSIEMDKLLGGGIPRGKFVELASNPGVGKTLIALHLCRALMQHTDYSALFIDAERGLTDELLADTLGEHEGKRFGVFKTKMYEEVDEIITNFLVRDKKLRLVVIDSITVVRPREVLIKPVGQARPGINAQFQSDFMDRQKELAGQFGVAFFFVNQVRTKFNFTGVTTIEGSGGWGFKHAQDVRLRARAIKTFKDSLGNIKSAELEVKAIKNKLAGNHKVVLMADYGKGINNLASYVRYLADADVLTERSGTYTMTLPGIAEPVVARGRDGIEAAIKEHWTVIEPILSKINVAPETGEDDVADDAVEVAEGE